METDFKTESCIKWPRGNLAVLGTEQFMMIEDLYKTTDKLNKQLNLGVNKVNIEFLRTKRRVIDIEKLIKTEK